MDAELLLHVVVLLVISRHFILLTVTWCQWMKICLERRVQS